ncbi:MAG TPA: aldo/keto reductase [Candidatus Hydrogenedentes bacterium]|nr:aldo/keto reductase [Candidatus Hydrogenedentota bacterium]
MNTATSDIETLSWRGESISRLILGTVQLGMPYGIANTQGQPDLRVATEIVETALAGGVRYFDTAQSYGESEKVLGAVFRELGVLDQVCIASKLNVQLDPTDIPQLDTAISQSFNRLGVERLWCMMLHRASWLDYWDHGLGETLLHWCDSGRIQHLGVSIAGPAEAVRCLEHPDMEILQVPCNAWDRRLIQQRVFDTARERGKLCCVRSIYLQGLLTMSPEAVAQRLPAARDAAERWHAFCQRHALRPQEAAMRFALRVQTPLVVGAESPDQLRDTLDLMGKDPFSPELLDELSQTLDPVLTEEILEPWHWPNK